MVYTEKLAKELIDKHIGYAVWTYQNESYIFDMEKMTPDEIAYFDAVKKEQKEKVEKYYGIK